MRKLVIWVILGLTIFIGCRSYLSYDRRSSSDIPFHKRKPPSMNKAIIISAKGPQLEPQNYEIMGKVNSEINNLLRFQRHCKDALDMLRYETEVVGADALINVSCKKGKYSAQASGTAIIFKNREEALKVLEEIKAVLE